MKLFLMLFIAKKLNPQTMYISTKATSLLEKIKNIIQSALHLSFIYGTWTHFEKTAAPLAVEVYTQEPQSKIYQGGMS